MNIELRFLSKAVEDRNYVSFSHEGKTYKRVKALKIENDTLKSDAGSFKIKDIKKLIILKDKF